MSTAEVLQRDADELKRLSALTESANVKRILMTEAAKLAELASAEIKASQSLAQKSPEHAAATTASASASLPTTKIYNYGWDQSEKFLKIYVTFNGVHTYPSTNITASYGEKSFELQIIDEGKKMSHMLTIKHLLHSIKPADSYFKVKTDMVILFLKKASSEQWNCVTEAEKKSQESKVPKMDTDDDPNAGLMKLLKQMYDDGDDEMKRNIAKSWTEAREKKSTDEVMQL